MKIILSPAKKMRQSELEIPGMNMTMPVYLSKTKEILNWLKGKTEDELRTLWGCNEKIAEENFRRLENMELEEKFKEAKVPMIVVYFDENFETTYTEEYNLGNFELSKCQIESFARILLPSIREYYKDPKHVHESNEWAKQQNKQSIDT